LKSISRKPNLDGLARENKLAAYGVTAILAGNGFAPSEILRKLLLRQR